MLAHLELRNFKSISSVDLDFGPLNVLIGANGSGKSNLVTFFRLIHALVNGELQDFVTQCGGAAACLHAWCGNAESPELKARLVFKRDSYTYNYKLVLSQLMNAFVFAEELLEIEDASGSLQRHALGSGHQESALATRELEGPVFEFVSLLQQCQFYQFHDTSATAALKQGSPMDDCKILASNGGNLSAFLYSLSLNYPQHYFRIVETVRQVFPHFGDFALRPGERGIVNLNWTEEGCEQVFDSNLLSDGTLRFIALATLLLQPSEKLPLIILVDEPELGLHPFALNLLASLIHNASHLAQVILATQSVEMIDSFEPETVIVAERPEHETVFKRLNSEKYVDWLQEYSLGELWKKNVLGGRPSK